MSYEPNPQTTDLGARGAGRCGWIKKDGTPCKLIAGAGTTHKGQGCCKKHNGAGGRNPSHGLYALIERERVQELLTAASAMEDPLDLMPDLLLLRSLTVDWIERYDELVEAIIAWHESYQNPERTHKPTLVPDIAEATLLLDRIGAMAERIEKRSLRSSISIETFNAAIDAYATQAAIAIRENVDDPDMRAKLGRAIEGRTRSVLNDLLGAGNGQRPVRRPAA